jgi:hypothetical protein
MSELEIRPLTDEELDYVGGGPTAVEYAVEVANLIQKYVPPQFQNAVQSFLKTVPQPVLDAVLNQLAPFA